MRVLVIGFLLAGVAYAEEHYLASVQTYQEKEFQLIVEGKRSNSSINLRLLGSLYTESRGVKVRRSFAIYENMARYVMENFCTERKRPRGTLYFYSKKYPDLFPKVTVSGAYRRYLDSDFFRIRIGYSVGDQGIAITGDLDCRL